MHNDPCSAVCARASPARIRRGVALALGAATWAVCFSGMACALELAAPARLKQMMAKEIAYRLGIKVEQVPLSDITPPELHRPFERETDCSGRAAFHYSAGFRVEMAQQRGFQTMAVHTGSGAAGRYRDRLTEGRYNRWPGAGVRLNFWSARRQLSEGKAGYSGATRWPQYPTERQFLKSLPTAVTPQRWPQYPTERQFLKSLPTAVTPQRWPQYQRPAGARVLSTLEIPQANPPGQGLCRYEGVAVVLGGDDKSPVAVNFEQRCA